MKYNPFLIGIDRSGNLDQIQKLIVTNILTFICLTINVIYFIFLMIMDRPEIALINLGCGILVAVIAYGAMLNRNYQFVKIFNLLIIPFIFIVFSFLYGDLGFNLFLTMICITSFFILDNKFIIFAINFWIFLVFIIINIGLAENYFVALDADLECWGKIFYWSNTMLGFICNFAILLVFKIQNLNYLKDLKYKNIQNIQKNEEIKTHRDKIKTQYDVIVQRNKEIESKNTEIEKKNSELTDLNITKDKFFAIIAHDLRSPFNALVGFSEYLLKNLDTPDKINIKYIVELIKDTSNQTSKLLENLLEWANLQTGKMLPRIKKYNLKEIIEDELALNTEIANRKKITLQNNIISDIYILCDRDMIKTVLRNLISNAVKFTKTNGTISLYASYYGNFAQIRVIDTGIGIEAEKMDYLFLIEKNVSTKGTNAELGTGLGLSLCKELIEKQGGTIWAESEVGKGSTFYFTAPVAI